MIRVGIAGYGNLGRGVESALFHSKDMEAVAVFTRRDPSTLKTKTNLPVYSFDSTKDMADDIDVMILCGGSANDLPTQTVELSKYFNVVDSFDTHAKIPEHFSRVDESCKANNKIGIISIGWDPGLFSLNRLYGQAVLPNGNDYTFWGKGVSQGHSDAIRRIDGVQDARQYTIPVESSLKASETAKIPSLQHVRSIQESALSLQKRAQISQKLKTKSRQCLTILQITIQPFTSSLRRN